MLVIVGRKGWLFDGVFAAVETHGIADRVRFLDYLPDGELAALDRLQEFGMATPKSQRLRTSAGMAAA